MILAFIKTIYLSLFPQPNIYKKLLHKPLLFAFAYFLALIFLFNTLFSISIIKNHLSSETNYFSIKSTVFNQLTNFPKDLIVTIHNGVLMSSYNKPYFFSYPFLVVDEFATDKQIIQYHSTIVLNRDAINLVRSNHIEKISYPYVNSQISHNSIKQFLPLIKITYATLPFIAIAYLFFFQPLIMVIKISFFLAIISFIYRFALKKTKHNVLFNSLFHVGLYSSTLPILCYYVIKILGGEFKSMYWLPILIAIFLLAAIYEVYIYKEKRDKSTWSFI